jgi:hypothetical protein
MTVSNEDSPVDPNREDIEAAVTALYDWSYSGRQLPAGHCRSLVLVLVGLGWAPRPTVELRALAELRTRVHGEVMIANYLRECGIEVID